MIFTMDPKEARAAACLKLMMTFINSINISLLPTDKEEQDSSRQLTQMSATQECHIANLDLQASKAVTAVAPFYGCLC